MTTETTIVNTSKQVVRGIEGIKELFANNGINIEEYRGKEVELFQKISSFATTDPKKFQELSLAYSSVVKWLGINKEKKERKATVELSDFECVLARYMKETKLSIEEVKVLFENFFNREERINIVKDALLRDRLPRPSWAKTTKEE